MTTDDSGGAAETVPIHAPSLLRRMSCWVYEGMLLFAVVFMASYLFSSLTQTRHGLQNRLGQQIFIFLVLGIYFSWFWHKGQTLARYVLSWIWFVPPLVLTQWLGLPLTVGLLLCPIWIMLWACLTYFRADRQFVHDHWAGTRMVDVRPAKIAT
ncbi:MAG: RDD family protein [Betaproteobacteria bacterium]|nr:RDD family protein [Betaproteobacteria bacterium]